MEIQETGFVTFVTSLIGDTIDAVVSSQLEQERKLMALRQDLLLSDDEIKKKYDLIDKAKELFGKDISEENQDNYIKSYVEEYRVMLEKYFQDNTMKVMVDRGKISAKMILSFSEDKEEISEKITPKSKSKGAKSRNLSLQPLLPQKKIIYDKMNSILFNAKSIKMESVSRNIPKVVVKPVSTGNKDMLDLKTDIVSHVEFSFRTIME